MQTHWNNDELLKALSTPGEGNEHTRDCQPCREEERGVREALEAFRGEVHSSAERPAAFWHQQRSDIFGRLASHSAYMNLRWALASCAALMAVAGTLLVPARAPEAIPTQAAVVKHTAPAAHHISDEALLRQIEETLNSSVPDALAPADLLVSDMRKNLEKQSSSRQ